MNEGKLEINYGVLNIIQWCINLSRNFFFVFQLLCKCHCILTMTSRSHVSSTVGLRLIRSVFRENQKFPCLKFSGFYYTIYFCFKASSETKYQHVHTAVYSYVQREKHLIWRVFMNCCKEFCMQVTEDAVTLVGQLIVSCEYSTIIIN